MKLHSVLLYTLVVALLTIPTGGCAAVSEWLSEPAGEGPIVFEDPETGTQVAVDLPEGAKPEPITLEFPEGSGTMVTFTPVQREREKTRADRIASFLSGVFGSVVQNPLISIVVTNALAAAASRFRKPSAETA